MRTSWFAAGAAILLAVSSSPAKANCTGEQIDAAGRRLWVDAKGAGKTTVVFEAGNGNDSSVWADIAPRIRAQGARTFVYDRAGLGKSGPPPARYSIDGDADALRTALDRCGIARPIIIVAHSYGGFIALLTAAKDRRVAGLVMVDANIPSFSDPAEVQSILDEYRPQYAELREQAPALAATIIPLMEAYPDTAKRLRATPISTTLPIIDIVAEHSWVTTPKDVAGWRKAHADFVAASRSREAIFAAGSSHKVMHDNPDLVLDAITRMIRKVDPR